MKLHNRKQDETNWNNKKQAGPSYNRVTYFRSRWQHKTTNLTQPKTTTKNIYLQHSEHSSGEEKLKNKLKPLESIFDARSTKRQTCTTFLYMNNPKQPKATWTTLNNPNDLNVLKNINN